MSPTFAHDTSSYDIVYGGSGNDRFEIEGYARDYYSESGNDTFFSVETANRLCPIGWI